MTRRRNVTVPPLNGGNACPVLQEDRFCAVDVELFDPENYGGNSRIVTTLKPEVCYNIDKCFDNRASSVKVQQIFLDDPHITFFDLTNCIDGGELRTRMLSNNVKANL